MSLRFLKPRSLPAVKVCGLRSIEQSEAVIEAGADAIGFNFWPKSKRYLKPADWLEEVVGATRVGLFVNAEIDEISEIYNRGLFDVAQLHGDESPEFLTALCASGVPAFKAMGVKNRDTLDLVEDYPGSLILLDAYAPVERGGTGETMDWTLGREAVERFPDRKIFLAGGLRPETVAAAVAQVRPDGVDVASGVESGTPGVKDLAKVRDFVAAAKGL